MRGAKPATLTALEALSLGLMAVLDREPPLPPLVPEWNGEPAVELGLIYVDAQARRLAGRLAAAYVAAVQA